MSRPMELPPENKTVLVWLDDDDVPHIGTRIGEHMQGSGLFVRVQHVSAWVPLSLARKAREMEAVAEASKQVLDTIGAPWAETKHELIALAGLRAALRDAGMGGGK